MCYRSWFWFHHPVRVSRARIQLSRSPQAAGQLVQEDRGKGTRWRAYFFPGEQGLPDFLRAVQAAVSVFFVSQLWTELECITNHTKQRERVGAQLLLVLCKLEA